MSVWKWFRKRTDPPQRLEEPALRGAPRVSRTKTYSADTGYVYQYVYRGFRDFSEGEGGTEYVFSAVRGRNVKFTIMVRLLSAEVADCARRVGRELVPAEHYALAKMTLFEALDSVSDITEFQEPIVPSAEQMEGYLRTLGRV